MTKDLKWWWDEPLFGYTDYLKDGLSLMQSFLGHFLFQLNGHFGQDEVQVLIYIYAYKKENIQVRINVKHRQFLFPIYNHLVYAF